MRPAISLARAQPANSPKMPLDSLISAWCFLLAFAFIVDENVIDAVALFAVVIVIYK